VNGRYQLGAEIGRGSSAVVFAATDIRLDRPVTVKLFSPAIAADPALRARFQQQTAKAASLKHPHIAALLDAGFTQEHGREEPFVITEPVGPLSLGGLLQREQRLAPTLAVRLTRQVASALGVAHRQGLVHADVKPENVLVDPHGQHAKLVDFSLSFVTALTGRVTAETLARRAAYLAPEQVQGQPVAPTTDVYGLGVLLYEMLVGRPPFVGVTPQATAERRVTERARPASLFDPSVPPDIERIISRCLERDPRQRWASMEELDNALAQAEIQHARPAGVGLSERAEAPEWPAARRWTRRSSPRLGLAIPVVAVLLAVGLALWSIGPILGAAGSLQKLVSSSHVEVPNLVGMNMDSARELARARGLSVQVVGERTTDREPRGTIIQQAPVAGRGQDPQQPVRVTVSSGVQVPDIRGRYLEVASKEIAEKGWRIAKVDKSEQPGHPSGVIALQSPAPWETASVPGELAVIVAE
jgi:serine/threonine-protein kinase